MVTRLANELYRLLGAQAVSLGSWDNSDPPEGGRDHTAEERAEEASPIEKGKIVSETTFQRQIGDFMLFVESYCDEARNLSSAGPEWKQNHDLEWWSWDIAKRGVLSRGRQLAKKLLAGGHPIERLLAFLKDIELDGMKEPPRGDYPTWDEAKVWLWQLELQAEKSSLDTRPARGEQSQETGAGRDTTKGEQAERTGEQTRQERIASLTPAVRKAYLSFEAACRKAEKKDMEDWEAHKLLKEEGIPEDSQGELTDYQLPALESWSRYLREARQALGEQKYTPRRGRQHGKSIVRQDQIETPDTEDE